MSSVLDAYLARVLEAGRGVLGDDLLGAYLTGSLALGGYVPGRSDIDVVAVTTGERKRAMLGALVDLLAHPVLPCPAPKLELVVYPSSAVQGARPSLDWSLNLNTGPEVGVRASFDPADEPWHWFVLDVAAAREHARPLTGIPPRAAFAPLERPRVLTALLESLRWHAEHDDRGVQAVLNGCRALRFATQGRWFSKKEAAAWAHAHGPDPELVAMATEAWDGGGDDRLDRRRVGGFLTAIGERIDRAAEG